MPFRLTTFGDLALQDANTQRRLAIPRKALALLSILASARPNGGVARAKILGLLWPDADDAGRGALKQTIYELRQTLGERNVIAGTTDLSLEPSLITSDVADFDAACAAHDWRRAADLYTGPFLDRFAVRGAAEFDHWADAQRAHYHARYAAALQRAADDAAGRGDAPEAVALWRRLAAAEPLSGRTAAGLIDALANAGDASGALAHFRIHAELLKKELGSEPDAGLIAVVERVRARVETPVAQAVARPTPAAAPDAANTSLAARSAERFANHAEAAPSRAAARRRRTLVFGMVAVLSAAAAVAAWRERAHAHVVASVRLPHDSFRIAVDAGERIYVDGGANYGAGLIVIGAGDLRERRLPYGAGALVDPVTHWYWAGDYAGHAVIVRNGFTDVEIGRINLRGCPHYLAPDGNLILVAEQCDDQIAVIDNHTRRLIREIPIPTLSRADVGGSKGMGDIQVNANTGIAYFQKDGIPERLDPRTWEVRETPGFGGTVIGVNQLMDRLYVEFETGLRVIDGTTEKVVAEMTLPAVPRAVAVGIGGQRVFVATKKGLVVLDGRSNTIRSVLTFAGDFEPDAVAVDEALGRAYVVGQDPRGGRALKVVAVDD